MSASDAIAEDRAIASLVRKGASLSVDDKGNVKTIFIADVSFNESELKQFAFFPKLVELNLATCEVGDAIWPYLANSTVLKPPSLGF